MADPGGLNRIWFGTGAGPRAVRLMLRPAEVVFGLASRARSAMYDRGMVGAERPALPALSIGNLTVGGTGKTPVAAWAAARLAERGRRPAIVLRGYGADEPEVHALLNPSVPVIVAAVRADGVRTARDRGCDVAVLDDAFQHRRVARDVDWVLVSADRWTDRRHLLPAGPWREPVSALRRATVAIVTRKAATPTTARTVAQELRRLVPGVPTAVIHLAPAMLRSVGGTGSQPLSALAGARVMLIAGIGDPGALQRQLEALGAHVRAPHFGDHHAFTDAEIMSLADAARTDELVVCTLKDAVKIGPRWTRAAPALWYVSQRVAVEEGDDLLAGSLGALLHARSPDPDVALPGEPYL